MFVFKEDQETMAVSLGPDLVRGALAREKFLVAAPRNQRQIAKEFGNRSPRLRGGH